MVKKHMRSDDGVYHINGHKYEVLKGSRAQVWHGTAYQTKGELKKSELIMTKRGRIVSKKKHATAKREKRLEKAGYKPKKGKFVLMRRGSRTRKARRSKRSKSRRARKSRGRR